MMGRETLIDQALAAVAAARPAGGPIEAELVFGAPIGITPEQSLVWSIYLAQKDKVLGVTDEVLGAGAADKEIERCVRIASSASIPETEIQAAIAAADAAHA